MRGTGGETGVELRGRDSAVERARSGSGVREEGSEMLRNPKSRLYTCPVEDRYGFLLRLGARTLFLEVGLIACPPPKIDHFWRRLPYNDCLSK